ncbi:16986_t:CDS:2, partial [Racocetra persica]
MWIYVNKPVQSLMYILEVDLPIEYPNQIPNENLSEPVGVKKLKEKYRIHPPQKFTYVSKYPQLIKDVIVESQEKNTSFIRVIIQNKEGKILMIKEKKRGWMFPGGKIEEGETPEEAAKREVFEETNLVVKNLKKAKERAFFFDDRRIKNKQQKGY